jgi:hypothetical protein
MFFDCVTSWVQFGDESDLKHNLCLIIITWSTVHYT